MLLKNGGVKVGDMDVIIAKTPPFEYPAALLSAGTKAKVVFLGEPRYFSKKYFDIVVSTPSTFCSGADIVLETLPAKLYEELDFDGALVNKEISVWSLVLGGDAKGYSYDLSFFNSLCGEMARISEVLGVKWIISSSPRTSSMAEKVMIEFSSMHPEWIEDCVIWGKGKRLSLSEIFKRSEMALITEDSASMISEAVNHRVKTVCIRPDVVKYNGLIAPLMTELEKKRRILRVSLSEMSRLSVQEIKDFNFQLLQESWIEAWERQAMLAHGKNN